MSQFVLQRLMQLEVEAAWRDRGDARTSQRYGYSERSLEARVGTLELRIPKLRSESYFPSFLQSRKASEQALVAVVQEA